MIATRATDVLAGFFSDDVDAVLAAIAAMASDGAEGRTFGEVTSTGTFTRVQGSDRLRFARHGLFDEVTFGPARAFACACGAVTGRAHAGAVCERCDVLCGPDSLRGERYGHVEVRQVVHPAALRVLGSALGWYGVDLGAVAAGEVYLRGAAEVHRWHAEEGDVTGAPALADALRALDPEHPLLPLCTIRRVPVPPPAARPFVGGLAPTMIDPWIGPVNQAWIGLVERATREARLAALGASPELLRDEARAVQRAFEAVLAASRPTPPLVPPLVAVPEALTDDEALGLAYVADDTLVVQRADGVHVISGAGAVLRAAPPAGCRLVGVLPGGVAVFRGFFRETDPVFMEDAAPWGGFVRHDEDGVRRVGPHVDAMSALDCETGEYRVDAPVGLPPGVVENDEPEDLFFADPTSGRRFRLHVGGDRPRELAATRDLQLAWIGEDEDTQVIERSRGICQVVPAYPHRVEATLELAAVDDEEDDGGGYGCALAFRGGAFHFLWPHGVVADHRGDHALQLSPAPRAGAFDPSGERLAVVVGSEVVILDVDRRAVIRRFALPTGGRGGGS